MYHRNSLKIIIVISIFLGNINLTSSWAMDQVYEGEVRVSLIINGKDQVNYEALTDSDDYKSRTNRFHKREDRDNDRGCDGENYLFAFAGVVTSALAIITGGMAYWLYP